MELKGQPTNTFYPQTKHHETILLTDIHSACAARIATLSPVIQDQAAKFLRFVETLLGKITDTASETCRRYFEEINSRPKEFSRLASSYLEHMALSINRDVDIIYEALQLSTIDHMQHYIHRAKSDPDRQPYFRADTEFPF